MADFLTQAWPFAAAVLVILGIVALVFLVIILYRASKTMKSVQNMAESAEKEIAPALAKVNPMVDKAELLVDTVNLEMLRVDAILEDVEQISNVAGKTANTVDTVTSAPAEAVTSLVDRIRGTIGGKRSDKLKQSRVVYPIGAAAEAGDVTAHDATAASEQSEAQAPAAEDATPAADIERAAEHEAHEAIEERVEAEVEAIAEPARFQSLGRHSIPTAASGDDSEPILETE